MTQDRDHPMCSTSSHFYHTHNIHERKPTEEVFLTGVPVIHGAMPENKEKIQIIFMATISLPHHLKVQLSILKIRVNNDV